MPVIMTLAEVRTWIQPADIFHRCTCLNCSVTLATKAEECICCKEIDRVDEIMSELNQAGDCVTLHPGFQDVCLKLGSCGIAHSQDQSWEELLDHFQSRSSERIRVSYFISFFYFVSYAGYSFLLLSIYCHFLRILRQVNTVVHKQMAHCYS